MYNVLPEDLQNDLKKEYRLRFLVVALRLAIIIFIIGSFALAPSIILSYTKQKELKIELSQLQEGNPKSKVKEYVEATKDLEEKITFLLQTSLGGEPDTLLLSIINGKPQGISLTRFTVNQVGTSTKIILDGEADKRDDLLAFQKILQKTKPLSKAVFPVGLLAQERDIKFTIEAQ